MNLYKLTEEDEEDYEEGIGEDGRYIWVDKFGNITEYAKDGDEWYLVGSWEKETIINEFLPDPNIEVTKTYAPANPQTGDKVTYTITVKNTGNVPLDILNLWDSMAYPDTDNPYFFGEDEDGWLGDPLEPGDSLTLTYDKTFDAPGTYANHVTAAAFYLPYGEWDSEFPEEGAQRAESTTSASVTVTPKPAPPSSPPSNPPTPNQVVLTTTVEGNGTVLPAGTGAYSENSVVQLTVTPGEGYRFDGWFGPNGSEVTDNRILMNASKQITARFVPISPPASPAPSAPAEQTIPEPSAPAAAPELSGTDEIVTDTAVPLAAPELPKTAGLPLPLLIGSGGMLLATGGWLRRKVRNTGK